MPYPDDIIAKTIHRHGNDFKASPRSALNSFRQCLSNLLELPVMRELVRSDTLKVENLYTISNGHIRLLTLGQCRQLIDVYYALKHRSAFKDKRVTLKDMIVVDGDEIDILSVSAASHIAKIPSNLDFYRVECRSQEISLELKNPQEMRVNGTPLKMFDRGNGDMKSVVSSVSIKTPQQ